MECVYMTYFMCRIFAVLLSYFIFVASQSNQNGKYRCNYYHTGHSFRRSGEFIAVAMEISSQKRWIKNGRLLLSVSLWLNFTLCFNVLPETPCKTRTHKCTFLTYYTHTVQFIAICANTHVRFGVGTQLLIHIKHVQICAKRPFNAPALHHI
jgi:hypothetical protein